MRLKHVKDRPLVCVCGGDRPRGHREVHVQICTSRGRRAIPSGSVRIGCLRLPWNGLRANESQERVTVTVRQPAHKMRIYKGLLPSLRESTDRLKALLTLNSLSNGRNRRIVAQIMAMWPFFRKCRHPGNSSQNEASRYPIVLTSRSPNRGRRFRAHWHMLRSQQYPPDARKGLRKFQLGEVADFMGVTQSHLRQIHSEGKGPEIESVGGRRYYTAEQMLELREYLEANKKSDKRYYLPKRREGEPMQVRISRQLQGRKRQDHNCCPPRPVSCVDRTPRPCHRSRSPGLAHLIVRNPARTGRDGFAL